MQFFSINLRKQTEDRRPKSVGRTYYYTYLSKSVKISQLKLSSICWELGWNSVGIAWQIWIKCSGVYNVYIFTHNILLLIVRCSEVIVFLTLFYERQSSLLPDAWVRWCFSCNIVTLLTPDTGHTLCLVLLSKRRQ